MAANLDTTTGIVKRLLTEEPATRGSDNLLIQRVLEVIAAHYGVDLEEVSIVTFLHEYAGSEFPAFETIRRTRQKVQQQYPELKPNETVQKFRAEQERQYREFARGAV